MKRLPRTQIDLQSAPVIHILHAAGAHHWTNEQANEYMAKELAKCKQPAIYGFLSHFPRIVAIAVVLLLCAGIVGAFSLLASNTTGPTAHWWLQGFISFGAELAAAACVVTLFAMWVSYLNRARWEVASLAEYKRVRSVPSTFLAMVHRIERLKPGTEIKVAFLKDDPVGYAVTDPGTPREQCHPIVIWDETGKIVSPPR
jgi:hypothetical protein